MAFRVLYDANAIFGALQRSILVRVGVVQARFNLRVLLTERIIDEMIDQVSATYPDFSASQGAGLKEAIIAAIPDCLVTGFEYAIDAAEIADPDDRHVIAAAIHADAQTIVTNDQDFAPDVLRPHAIDRQSPDDFLTDLFDLDQAAMRQVVSDEAATRDLAFEEVVELLEQRGLIRFAQHLRR
jgi:predicted nucleic acid-binding protein